MRNFPNFSTLASFYCAGLTPWRQTNLAAPAGNLSYTDFGVSCLKILPDPIHFSRRELLLASPTVDTLISFPLPMGLPPLAVPLSLVRYSHHKSLLMTKAVIAPIYLPKSACDDLRPMG